jgi:replicative DNA helicase
MLEFKEYIHYGKDLEVAILGACMLEKSAVGRLYGIVEPKHFYVADNQKVCAILFEMFDKNVPVDIYTVCEFMHRREIKLDASDSIAYYLCWLTKTVVSTAHLEYHSLLIKDMWKKRELEKLTVCGIDPHGDPTAQIGEINQKIAEIIGNDYKQDWYSMDQIMFNLLKHQGDIKEGKGNIITTGFRAINKLNGGFWGGQFIILGARPSVGKSALMGKMAVAMAKEKKKVGIISLEMNNEEIAARFASLETGYDFQTIYRNLFEDQQQHEQFYNIISRDTINLPIYVSDKTKVDINEIKAKAFKLRNKIGCDCLMVDYLQLVSSESAKNSNREQEVSKISRGLKLLAMEINCPVIALCQLSREVTKRSAKDRYPRPSDLRESGSLEQDADVILMLHRDWEAGYEENEQGQTTEFEADLLGMKWRNGAKFHLKLDFEPARMKFSEQSSMHQWRPVNDFAERTEVKNNIDKDDEDPF